MVKIKNTGDLRDWLKDKPKEYSVVVTSRLALRALPLVGRIYEVNVSEKFKSNLTKATFQANLISWVTCKYAPHGIGRAAARAANAAYPAAYDARTTAYVVRTNDASYAAARAANAADAADAAHTTRSTFYTSTDAADVGLLEQGLIKPEQLTKQPLWQGEYMAEMDIEWQKLKQNLLSLDEDWEVWIGWYEDILAGRNWAGLPDDLVEKLSIKIAEQNDEWWERDSALINADMKKWRYEAKAGADERTPELTTKEFLQKAKDTASPRPIINDDNQLDVTSKTEINEPIAKEELHLFPERARRQINNLLVAFEKKNVSPILKSSLRSYLDELDKGFDFEITYLDDDMAIIRSERDADIEGIWCDAGIKTAINNLSDIHDKIQKHYPLDLKREEYIRQAPIDPKMFDVEEYKQALEQFVENTEVAYEKGEVSEAYLNAVKRQKRQYKDIATLYDVGNISEISVSSDDRIIPAKIKKRFLFQNAGFLGKTLDISHKLTGLALAAKKLWDIFINGQA